MVESILRHLGGPARSLERSYEDGIRHPKTRRILAGASEVSKSIFFSTAIIIAAFIPLFTMQGVEGQIFAPMAKTYGYAMIGALLATFTVAPVLSSFFLPETINEREPLLLRKIKPAYLVALRTALRHRYLTAGVAVLLLV